MTRPVRLLHLLGKLDVGGAERTVLALCANVPRCTLRQDVVVLSGRSGDLTGQFVNVGAQERRCGLSPRATFIFRFRRLLRRYRPDVVVSHVSLASGYLLAVAKLTRVTRRVAVFHSDGDGRAVTPGRRLYRSAGRTLLRWAATDVIGVTPTTLDFSGLSAHDPRAAVIPNSADTTVFRPLEQRLARSRLKLPQAATVLIHIGRAAPEKNRQLLPQLLRAMPTDTTLVLAGAPDRRDLRLPDADPLWTRIRDVGVVGDVSDLLTAADALVLPSVREGMPLVVLEALASGRPVIASGLPGLRSLAARLPDITLVSTEASGADFAQAVLSALAAARSPETISASVRDSALDLQSFTDRWVALCVPAR